MNCQEESSFQRLLHVTTYVLRFIDSLKKKSGDRCPDEGVFASVAQFMAEAESLWIKAAQRQLVTDGGFEKLNKQFGLFLDTEGIWRCGGRLSNANAPFHVKHPILLPRSHHLATLVVRRAYEKMIHNGVKDTLTEVQSRFWLLKG